MSNMAMAASGAGPLAATIAAARPATHDIRIIELALPPGARFDFRAGQYAKLGFAGHPLRDYSMASRPGAPRLEFHIRDMGDGPSRHAVRQAQAGDSVQLVGPLGDAWLRPEHRGPIIGIAGGSGLAPIKSIAEAALAAGATQPVHLYFGARSVRDLYLTEHFAALMQLHGNFRFVPVLSEPEPGAPHRRGLVGDAVADDFPSFAGSKAYLAGPPAMVEAAMALLQSRDMPAADIHADPFYSDEENKRRLALRGHTP